MLVGDQVDLKQFGQVPPPPGYPLPPGYVPPPPGYPMTYAPSYPAPGYPVPPGYPTTGYPTTAYPTGPYVPPTSTTPVPVTPTGPTGTQTIPVVQIGPVRVMDKSGYAVGGVRATVRTPGRIVKTEEVPGGIYQTTVDRSDFDAGITVIFGAPDRAPVTVPGNAIFCNTGTRNEFNTITSMTQNPCPPQSYYFESAQEVERPGAPAAVPVPAPVAAPAPASQAPRKKRRRAGGGTPAEEAAPAATQAPGRVLIATGETSPLLYVGIGGAALLVIGIVFFMMKK